MEYNNNTNYTEKVVDIMSKYVILHEETDVKTIYGILIFPHTTPKEEGEVDYINIVNVPPL